MSSMKFKDYLITNDQKLFRAEDVKRLLDQAYYAHNRPMDIIAKSIENSFCYGVFTEDNKLVGFARILTDFVLTYYVTDVIVDAEYRNHGIGTHMIKFIVESEETKGMKGVLLTTYSHDFYEKLGFERNAQKCMIHFKDAIMHLIEDM